MVRLWSDLTPEEKAWYTDREQLLAQLAAATARAEAAEQALRLATKMTTGSTSVMMRLDVWENFLATIERFGADQWRNGNAGREPQEWNEWRKEQP